MLSIKKIFKNNHSQKEVNRINDIGDGNVVSYGDTDLNSSSIKINGNANKLSFANCQFLNTYITLDNSNNIVDLNGVTLANTSINISGNNNHISFGENTSLVNAEIHIYGNNHELIIEDGVQVYGKVVLWFEDNFNKIKIGKYTTIGSANISIAEFNSTITIGTDCMLANNITIKNSDFHSIIDLESDERINPAGNVHIGNHVWIGENTHILKGVNISDNSITALGSVVTKSVPSGCIVAGIPARIIKENVTWSRQKI